MRFASWPVSAGIVAMVLLLAACTENRIYRDPLISMSCRPGSDMPEKCFTAPDEEYVTGRYQTPYSLNFFEVTDQGAAWNRQQMTQLYRKIEREAGADGAL